MKQDVMSNMIGGFAPSIVTLITLPITFNNFGSDFYGSFYLIMSYLSLQVLYSMSVTTFANIERANTQKISLNIVYTFAVICSAIAVIASVLLLTYFAQHIINALRFDDRFDYIVSACIIILYLPITIVNATSRGILQGDKKFIDLNINIVFFNALNPILICVFSFWYNEKVSIFLFIFFALHGMETIFLMRKIKFKEKFRLEISKSIILAKKYKWLILNGTLSNFFPIIDRTIIAYTLDLRTLGIYTLALQLVSKLHMVIQAFNSVFLQRAARTQSEEQKKLFSQSNLQTILIISLSSYLPLSYIFQLYLTNTTNTFGSSEVWIIYAVTGFQLINTCSRFALNVNYIVGDMRSVVFYSAAEIFLFSVFIIVIANSYGLSGLIVCLFVRETALFLFLSKNIITVRSVFIFIFLLISIIISGVKQHV